MDILITTYGRPNDQVTLKSVPTATLVVQHRERDRYVRHTGEMIVLPPEITTLSVTRQWLLENPELGGHVCLLDDDLTFAVRRTDNPTLFRPVTQADLEEMFNAIDVALIQYAHAGIAAREGANRTTEDRRFNTRVLRLLAYDFDVVRLHPEIRFDRLVCMSDFDMTLQLLRAGQPNVLLNRWCQNQHGSNARGGCSSYRTKDVLATAAEGLQRLHPDFVRIVTKTTKGAWGGGERKDVTIQWKKAFESGLL